MTVPVEYRERPRELGSVYALVLPLFVEVWIYLYLCLHLNWNDAQSSFFLGTDSDWSSHRLILFACCVVRSTSQAIYGIRIQTYYFPPFVAFCISLLEGFVDVVILGYSLIMVAADGGVSHQATKGYLTSALLCTFLVGIYIERGSEYQRALWKEVDSNKGKPYTQGMFGSIVHANYYGYCVWRFAHCGLTGSLRFQLTLTSLFIGAFVFGDIPKQYERNRKKYGPKWTRFYHQTPKLIPGVY